MTMFPVMQAFSASIYGSDYSGGSAKAVFILKGLFYIGLGLFLILRARENAEEHLRWVTDDDATPSEGAVFRNRLGSFILAGAGLFCLVLTIAL